MAGPKVKALRSLSNRLRALERARQSTDRRAGGGSRPPETGADPGAAPGELEDAARRRGESTIRWHLKHMFTKHGLSRQADLVRLVLSLGAAPESRR